MTPRAIQEDAGFAQERRRLIELLEDAEGRAARVPELERRIEDLEYQLGEANQQLEKVRREVWELDQLLMYSRRLLRFVRPLIGPLRQARKRLRS